VGNIKSYKERLIEQFANTTKIGLFNSIMIVLSTLILFYIIAELISPLYLLGVGIALLGIYLIINSYNNWIYIFIIALPGYLFFSEEGLGAEDIVYMFLYNFGLLYWFIHTIFIKKERIIENRKEWFLLFIFIILAVHPIVAFYNDVLIINAYREYAITSLTLFYFPLKMLFKDKKEFKKFLILLVIIVILIDFIQLYRTYSAFKSATQVWELSKATRMNQTIISMIILLALPITLFVKSKKYKLIGFLFVAFNIAMLISTLTRSYWVATFLAVIFMMFFLSSKKNIFIVFSGVFGFIIIFGIGYIVLQEKTILAYKLFEKRFTSIYSTSIRKNQSLNARTVEYEAVYRIIEEYPIGGVGAAKSYAYYSTLDFHKWESANIHSAYISLTYRYGFIIAFAYFLIFFIFFVDGVLALYKTRDNIYKYFLLGALSTLIMFALTNFVSSLVLTREGVIVMAISLAILTTAKNYLVNNDNNSKESNKGLIN